MINQFFFLVIVFLLKQQMLCYRNELGFFFLHQVNRLRPLIPSDVYEIEKRLSIVTIELTVNSFNCANVWFSQNLRFTRTFIEHLKRIFLAKHFF